MGLGASGLRGGLTGDAPVTLLANASLAVCSCEATASSSDVSLPIIATNTTVAEALKISEAHSAMQSPMTAVGEARFPVVCGDAAPQPKI